MAVRGASFSTDRAASDASQLVLSIFVVATVKDYRPRSESSDRHIDSMTCIKLYEIVSEPPTNRIALFYFTL